MENIAALLSFWGKQLMQKNDNDNTYKATSLASHSFDDHSAGIAEQMLSYFMQHAKEDISMQEVEDFSADHHIDVNDCFGVMSWLQNAKIIEKKLYDRATGEPVLPISEHRSANTPSKQNNVGVRWTLNAAY